MAQGGSWLEATIAAAAEGPVQVIARTSASAREVYRQFARQGATGAHAGWAGVEVTTLGGLLAALKPKSLRAPAAATGLQDLPAGHPWKGLLDDRPGLRRHLRQQVARIHEARLAGASLDGLRPELLLLVNEGWGTPDHLMAARRLLAHPPPPQRRFAVGFAAAPFSFLGSLGPLDRALLDALGATFVTAGAPTAGPPGPLRALRLSDPVAEARAVAREVRPGERMLVLVADTPSEERIHATLQRNGVPVADDGASPLARHSLASIIAPLLPLFASRGSTPLEARPLLRLLTDPVLARTPPAGQEVALPGLEKPRSSLRHVRDVILACRRIRASLDEWLELLGRLEAEAAQRATRANLEEQAGVLRFVASARVSLAQTRALSQHARAGGTLGDVAGLILDLGLASTEDRVGRALVRALLDEGHRPADADEFAEALGGGVGSGKIGEGVQVLHYSAYDGRPCDRLVLTGVHDKGLGKLPASDPLLLDCELKVVGLPTPREAVRERLALARWATMRARTAVALVCESDSAGRRVSPPPDLELEFEAPPAGDAYGLSFDLPETRDLRAYAAGGAERDPLATQIDTEWARAGIAFAGASPTPPPKGPTLADHLEAATKGVPEELQAWLGRAGPHPKSSTGLPPRFSLSASRLTAFTQCLYRAWCESVLRLEPREELEEDLDATEVGVAVHRALQDGLHGEHLLVPRAQVESRRRRALARLVEVTPGHIEDEAAATGRTDSEPLAVAREGLTRRWLLHWERYLERRVAALEDAVAAKAARALEDLEDSPLFARVLDEVGGAALKKAPREDLRRGLRRVLARSGGRLEEVLAAADEIASRLAACHRPRIRAALLGTGRDALSALCGALRERLGGERFDPAGDLEVAASELGFGQESPLELILGDAPVPVRGSIDAVLHRRGDASNRRATYRILDFKTGQRLAAEEQLAVSFTQPQLAFYGLVLGALGPLESKHQGPVHVEQFELDYVRSGKSIGAAVSSDTLERARALFGQLLDQARAGAFPLEPHPRGCPLLGARAWCAFEEICRLRPRPAAEERSTDESEEGVA